MRILGIETSCDETALSLIEASGDGVDARFSVLGNVLLSQVALHAEYGGVYPSLAKREHSRNLIPLLQKLLSESATEKSGSVAIDEAVLKEIFSHEPELFEAFIQYVPTIEAPQIDAIAVTEGPGLEPALWVGVNFAKALSLVWNVPIVPINHMEGHVVSSIVVEESESPLSFRMQHAQFPILALLISGGHTELVRMDNWHAYERIGNTRDDAVGEAFDKVARILGLPYPGGPAISKLAQEGRRPGEKSLYPLPRPMIDSGDLDFSFSGLKTAVLYTAQRIGTLSDDDKKALAAEFEDAATEVLLSKTKDALAQTGAKTLAIGGGVSANTRIREQFITTLRDEYPDVLVCIPDTRLSTDNALMIAMAGYFRAQSGDFAKPEDIAAVGNLSLEAN